MKLEKILHKYTSILIAIIMLAGCATVGPDYVAPEIKTPSQWNTSAPGGTPETDRSGDSLATWWMNLDDPALILLIEHALKNNIDVKKAESRIREARAQRGVSEAGLYPSVDGSGSYTLSRTENHSEAGKTRELFAAGLDAAWEIDLFGGVRRSVEASLASYEASREDYRMVYVSLAAEVALNYVDVRTFQERLAIVEENLKLQAETYELANHRYKAGLVTQLDVDRAKTSLDETRASIPSLTTNLIAARNRLSALMGEHPGYVDAKLADIKPLPVTPLSIALGVPAEMVRRRPDVRTAERELAAQTALVGVATAELYPKLNLAGSIGIDASTFGGLVSGNNRVAAIGPRMSWNIFNAGAVRSNIEIQNARQEQALLQYENTVLLALEEAENAITAYANEQVRAQSLEDAMKSSADSLQLVLAQYKSGLIDFQDVLDVQRTFLSVKDNLAVSKGTVISNLVRLYKALGGGWTPDMPRAAEGSSGTPTGHNRAG
ncbi:MAG: Antibiotic efflux pump outer membrane protein ArpC precursor [Syntrophorhabdus sp. PtaU1.Bin153]|nr:MAG: Antibiotic efflux pump outer membrane protein ArpC precursor [Syntrophorhabdus sp. PtaU1.Bin153]